jgi:cytochrome d ubiquinol oxidase subunit I
MITLGLYFIAITVLASFYRLRGTLFEKRWLMWMFVFSVGGAYVANQAGWVAAEVGRQPWVVYGHLRTADAVSEVVPAGDVLASIILFSIVYSALFLIWVFVVHSKIAHGPDAPEALAPEPDRTTGRGFVEASSRRNDPASGFSMTDAKSGWDEPPEVPGGVETPRGK